MCYHAHKQASVARKQKQKNMGVRQGSGRCHALRHPLPEVPLPDTPFQLNRLVSDPQVGDQRQADIDKG